jgi:NHLM bacteriocin system ABC transporter ATP-binding protein
MQSFSELIARKKNIDIRLLNNSIKEISGAITNNREILSCADCEDATVNEMNHILDYFQITRIDVPKDISGEDSKILYIMSGTNILRRKINLKDKWWKESALPLLCSRADGTLLALLPDQQGGYRYFDKDANRYKRLTGENVSGLNAVAYCFYKPFTGKPLTKSEFMRTLLKSFTAGDIIYLLAISLIVGLIGLVLPAINQFIFYKIIPSGGFKDIYGIAALLFGITIMSVLFVAVRTAWIYRIGNKIDLYAQNAIWVRIFNLPMEFFKSFESGELTQRALAVSQICTIISSGLIPTLLGSLFSFLYLLQISRVSGKLLLPSMIIIALMVASAILNSILQTRYANSCNKIENRLSSLIFQLLNSVAKIKIAGAEIRAFAKWSSLYSKKSQIPGLYIQAFSAINKLISFGGTIVLYLIAYRNQLSSSSYIAFNVAYGSFSAAILGLSNITSLIAAMKPALDLLEPILQAEPENDGCKKQIKSLQGDIEINQVTFRYKKDLPPVIDNLSLKIKKGEYIGIVGSSGCGKSTLLRLLLGFEKPESGAVYYDNRDLDGLDTRSVRQRIGIVLQNGKLFTGNIYSNIVICAPWLGKDDAWRAAEKAGLAKDIEAMPMGMYTMVSEGGIGLSGGQQQRLLIARALAADPDIIMFDEATSALDNVTQSIVVNTLEQLDITRIVIAHRLSTIRNCSKIIYLDKGRVAEAGTYEELMEQGGLFAKMANRQLL